MDELKVRREMDERIAREVMNWQAVGSAIGVVWYDGGNAKCNVRRWHPSTNIADAMAVADKLIVEGWEFKLRKHPGNKLWDASFDMTREHGYCPGRAETPPEAICLAALQVIEFRETIEKTA